MTCSSKIHIKGSWLQMTRMIETLCNFFFHLLRMFDKILLVEIHSTKEIIIERHLLE